MPSGSSGRLMSDRTLAMDLTFSGYTFHLDTAETEMGGIGGVDLEDPFDSLSCHVYAWRTTLWIVDRKMGVGEQINGKGDVGMMSDGIRRLGHGHAAQRWPIALGRVQYEVQVRMGHEMRVDA